MNDKFDITQAFGCITATVNGGLTALQTDETFKIIQFVATLVSILVTIAYTVWKWHRAAKKDNSDGGKDITKKEINELMDDLHDAFKDKDGDDDDDRN